MPPRAARSVFARRACVAAALAVAVLAPLPASAVAIDWVTVGTPGNAPTPNPMRCGPALTSRCGAVAAAYRLGKYEVTNGQYVEFLNAVAATDTNGLYNEYMESITQFGGITRSGSPGGHGYAARPGFESKPVVFVSFWDAMRLANWLHNGQPTGLQTAATTEGGAYTLTPAAIAANSVPRNVGARVFLPSDDEWYKAAYYDPIAGVYYDYPAGANAISGCVSPGSDTGNSANCNNAVGALTDVGAYALSESPSGTFDQGGNVWEWNEQVVWGGSVRGPRGGAWYIDASALRASNGYLVDATREGPEVGFRLASIVPEPSTGLLVLSGLGGLALRHRRRFERDAEERSSGCMAGSYECRKSPHRMPRCNRAASAPTCSRQSS